MAPDTGEFSYPRPNLVVSRNGYSVEVRLPNTILYEEGERRMAIFAEALATTEPKIAIRRKDVNHWDSADEETAVSDRDRDRILQNIQRAFGFKGWILAVE
jgi:hypothetical protein